MNNRFRYLLVGMCAVLFLSAIALLVFLKAMHEPINVDENQFIASGKVLLSNGWIPYRDYVYVHMPNLTFIYAAIFKWNNYLLLSARVFSVFCTWLLLATFFILSFSVFRKKSILLGIFAGVSSVIVFISQPLFLEASTRAWNHNIPQLFALWAFLAFLHGFRKSISPSWIFLSGFFLGNAIGIRITYITILPVFIGFFIWKVRFVDSIKRIRCSVGLFLGVIIPLIPSIWLFVISPHRFSVLFQLDKVFCISRFALLVSQIEMFWNTAWFAGGGPYFFMLIIAWVLIAILGISKLILKRNAYFFESALSFFLLVFAFLGALIPGATYAKYFYAVSPFVILNILYVIAGFEEYSSARNFSIVAVGVLICLSCYWGTLQYWRFFSEYSHAEWETLRVHRAGIEIKESMPWKTKNNKVLTLWPIFPLEGGMDIYKELVLGRLASGIYWWSSKSGNPQINGLSEYDSLNASLALDPPKALLTGLEPKRYVNREYFITGYAEKHCYKWFYLPEHKIMVWFSVREGCGDSL